jgi:excisionase family DNA binding protein
MNDVIRVSVSEAAKLFGIDQKTIRRAITAQQIKYIVVRNRYKINFESLLEWSQKRVAVRNKLTEHGIGQYVTEWKIKNTLYSPHPSLAKRHKKNQPLL